MYNRIVIIGRLTRDPDLRRTNTNDTPVASFTVAVDDRNKGVNGENSTIYFPVNVWNKQADNCAKYLKKGSLCCVDGRLRQRSYEKKDGTQASVLEIVADTVRFLEPKEDGAAMDSETIMSEHAPVSEEPSEENEGIDVIESDLPF